MKKNLKHIAFSVLLIGSLSSSVAAQESRLTWDFPVRPGTEEWKKLRNFEERVRVSQIPEEILHSLSTEELLELCLRYPFLINIFAFNNLNHGLDRLFIEFNGIRELFRRDDVATHLIQRYTQRIQSLSSLNDEGKTGLEKGSLIISTSILGVLLSRIEKQNREAGIDVYREILRSLVAGYEEILKHANYFQGLGFRTNLFSRAHVIVRMDSSFTEQLSQGRGRSVLFSGTVGDEETINLINERSLQLIR